MQIVSQELAIKILDMLEKGSSATASTLTDLLNEFLNYLIFVEVMSASKFLLTFLVILVLAKDTEEQKNLWRGIGVLSYLAVGVVGVVLSWSSLFNLGKVLFAPKIYLIEMAYDKVREYKATTNQGTK